MAGTGSGSVGFECKCDPHVEKVERVEVGVRVGAGVEVGGGAGRDTGTRLLSVTRCCISCTEINGFPICVPIFIAICCVILLSSISRAFPLKLLI